MSNFIVRGLFLAGIIVSLACLPGCHGSPITITMSCPGCTGTPNASVTISQGDTVAITASVANDKTNSGVSWSLGSSVGSLSSQTTTSVTYVAPTALTATTTAVVTATSIANTNVTETVTITISAVFQFQTTSLPIATKGVAYVANINTIGASGPFTWAITSGALPAGLSLSSSNTASVTITGTPTTVGTSTVTLQATNGSGTPISQSFTITVNPPPSLTITTPLTIAPGTTGQLYTYTLQAAYGTPPYSWSIISGALPSGLTCAGATLPCSLSDGVIYGTPTTVGTYSFTVQVEDSATPNRGIATATLTLTISEVLVNSDLNGNYAFLVSGYDLSGNSFAAAGSFFANGGGDITSGVMDTNDNGTVNSQVSLTGTYSIGADGLGTMTIQESSPPIERTFFLSFVPTSNVQTVNLIELDSSIKQASGVLLEQNPSQFGSVLTSGSRYAFGFLGGDTAGKRYGLAGAFTTNGAGIFDSDDAGISFETNMPFTASSSLPDTSTGRGTMAFSVSGVATSYTYYVVNLQQLIVIDATDLGAVVSGFMLAQTLGSAYLTDAVFETTALNTSSSSTSLSQVGVMTGSGGSSGSLTTSFDNNLGATPSSSGSYSIDSSTGRTTLTGSGLASPDPVLYLVQANEGFLVGTDAAVTFGFMKQQSVPTPPFSLASLNGLYAGGSIPPTLSAPALSGASVFCPGTWNGASTNVICFQEVDAASANGTGGLTVNFYANTSMGAFENFTANTGYSLVSNGRGTIPQSGSSAAVFYMVSDDEFWSLSENPNGMVIIFCVPGSSGTCGAYAYSSSP